MDNEITITYKQILVIALILIAIVGIFFFFKTGKKDIEGIYKDKAGVQSIEFLSDGLCRVNAVFNGHYLKKDIPYTQSGNYIYMEYETYEFYDINQKRLYNKNITLTIVDENTIKDETENTIYYKQK